MKIGIFGAGALGSVLGAYLSNEQEVVLYGRKIHLTEIERSGLRVSGVGGDRTYPIKCRDNLTKEHFDLGIIAVKTYDTISLLTQLDKEEVTLDAVASVQNGLKDKVLMEKFGRDKVLGCVVDEGAKLISPGHVGHTNRGFNYWGNFSPRERDGRKKELSDVLSATLTRSGLIAESSDFMGRITWYKFMSATMVAAVNGALDLDSAQKYLNPYASELLLEVVGEISDVTEAEGIVLSEHPVLSKLFLVDAKGRRALIEEKQEKLRGKNAEPHIPSLVQDLRKGKCRTEVDSIIGVMINVAKKHGISAPVIQACYQMIKAKEFENRGVIQP